MTSQDEFSPTKNFVRSWLPWLIAAAGLVIYAATLNHWVTTQSVGLVARIGDWDWQPGLFPPVFYLVTAPLRLLPANILPIALNLFSAVCATLTVALLARSVALLPHDRTHEQREREKNEFAFLSIRAAWLPPVFAVLACGLQLTFWENATAASSEMFELLLFAYAVRCLLEFRIDWRDSWLAKCAIVFGAGMANNWPMLAFLPFLVLALIWIKGTTFFDLGFVLRMVAWGLLGFSLILLLPIVFALSPVSPWNFWETLKFELSTDKVMILQLFYHKKLLVLLLYSLLPLGMIAVRWASSFGDSNPMGASLAAFTFHVAHAAFFLIGLWVMLDSPISPRRFSFEQADFYAFPFLKIYYLTALTIGYFAGYFLLVFGKAPPRGRPPGISNALNPAIAIGVWVLFVAAPVGLIYKNFPQIKFANAPLIRDYGRLALGSLPQKPTIVLSDDVQQLYFLKAAVNERGLQDKYVLMDTSFLKYTLYSKYLKRKFPGVDKAIFPGDTDAVLGDAAVQRLVEGFVRKYPVYYLQPSFGFFFEEFYPQPHGIVYELKPYATDSISAPPLTAEAVAENNRLWNSADDDVSSVVTALALPKIPREPGLGQNFLRTLSLTREADKNAGVVGGFYSRAQNFWGVALQQNGRLDDAGKFFASAQETNPDNVAARVNLACNQNLRAGRPAAVPPPKSSEDETGKYKNLQEIMGKCGLFDEPNRCFQQAQVFSNTKPPLVPLLTQAAQQFERVRTLAPDDLRAQFWLAQFYSQYDFPDRALEIIAGLQPKIASGALDQDTALQLGYLAAVAHFKRNETEQGSAALERVLKSFPSDENLLVAATKLYLGAGSFSNARDILDRHLKISPDNASALINKGYVCIQLKDYDTAIASLNRVISLQPTNYEAVFNRAVACLQSKKYDDAKKDYLALKELFPTSRQVYFGLGEIAYEKRDVPAAIENYQLYLSNSPTNNRENEIVIKRLNELKQQR